MGDPSIYIIRHSITPRTFGGILKNFVVEGDSLIGARFASMNCYYSVWKKDHEPTDVVGFFGYRKYMDFRDEPGSNGWKLVPLPWFDAYHEWLLTWDGSSLHRLLAHDDIIVTAPYPLVAEGGLSKDFCASRSPEDWKQFRKIMEQHGEWEWDIPEVTSHFFVTTRMVFDRFMVDWWEVFRDVYPLIQSPDAQANRP